MSTATLTTEALAINGGPKTVTHDDAELFHWPIVTAEDEAAVVQVMRTAGFSGTDITKQFEQEWSAYQGVEYSLGHPNGTAALLGAMYACGVGRGDEIIAPSLTYWASALQVFDLGATVVFADVDPDSLCIDPNDIEHRITPRTKAIMAVHYCGHPADIDPIVEIGKRHGIPVIEDVSHAHGAMYKGRMCGSLSEISAMSMMGGKSFAIGEAGMLCTNDRTMYERVIAFGHYEKTNAELNVPELKQFAGLPLGAYKFRMNQTCSAMGRVQLKYYPERIREIQDGMNRFWDLLEDVPGLRAHRPTNDGSTMGGWYNPVGHYLPEELGGLPVERFIEAVNAEGGRSGRGCNMPLHLHPVLNEADVYNDGKPTRIAFSDRDVRQGPGSLPVTEAVPQRCLGVPWFKHDRPEEIAQYAAAFRKVAERAEELLS